MKRAALLVVLFMLGAGARALWLRREPTFDEVWRLEAAKANGSALWGASEKLLGGNVLYPAALKLFGIRSKEGVRPTLVMLAALSASMVMSYLVFQSMFGRRVATGTTALVALSPFQVVHGGELKEYSLLLPFALMAVWAGWGSCRPNVRHRTWVLLSLSETACVGLALPSAYFCAGLGLTQAVLGGRGLSWTKWFLAHLPPALLCLSQVWGWPPGYERGFLNFAVSMDNGPLKLASDVLFNVEFWLWSPTVVEWQRLSHEPMFGGLVNAGAFVRFLRDVLPWFLGPPVIFGAIAGVVHSGRGHEREGGRAALYCGLVSFMPIIAYFAIFAIRGAPHLFHPRSFMAVTPALYALLVLGLLSLSGLMRGIALGALVCGLFLSLALLLTGKHPSLLPDARPLLNRAYEGMGEGNDVWVYPSEAYPYVLHLSPPPVRPRLHPLNLDPRRTRPGWVPTLFNGAYQEDFTLLEGVAGNPGLMVVTWALYWRDRDLKRLETTLHGWDLVESQPNLRFYRRLSSPRGS